MSRGGLKDRKARVSDAYQEFKRPVGSRYLRSEPEKLRSVQGSVSGLMFHLSGHHSDGG